MSHGNLILISNKIGGATLEILGLDAQTTYSLGHSEMK